MNGRLVTLVLIAALGAVGCATVPPAAGPPGDAVRWVTSSGRDTSVIRQEVARPVAPVAAAPDTVPSADALAVLAGIPEPLAGAERTARPSTAPTSVRAPAAAGATPDTTDEQGGAADVPVPVPTRVLGDRPLPDVAPTAEATPTAPAPSPTSSAPAAPTPAPADTCWRVQFAAWADRARAERYGEAVRSQLGTAVEIERQAGLFKVRSRDCLDGAAADTLRRRARESGFEGAFRFRGVRP